MANAGLVPLAVLSVSVVIVMCAVYVAFKKREEHDDEPQAVISVPAPLNMVVEEAARAVPAQAERRGGDYVRMKKDVIGSQPDMRFSMLQEWLSINMLAIFRRARGDWNKAADLIAIIPSYLEADAEILNNRILVVRTRGYDELLAIPLRNAVDDSTELDDYFDFITNGGAVKNIPAVLRREDKDFKVISKGTITQAVLRATDTIQHRYMEIHAFIAGASESLQEGFAATFGPMDSVVIAGWMSRQSRQDLSQAVHEFFHQQRMVTDCRSATVGALCERPSSVESTECGRP